MRLFAAATLTLVCLLLPGAARATTVTLEPASASERDYDPSALTIEAEAGDDHLVITGSEHEWRVRDDTQPVTAGGLCSAVGPHEATCPANTPIGEAQAMLLGGDDRLAVEGSLDTRLTVIGGPGSDRVDGSQAGSRSPVTLYGDEGDDALLGGPSDDHLVGGGGYDTLHGGEGKDTFEQFHGEPDGANLVDGGPGQDSISFWDHRALISVDLDAGNDSFGDSLSSIENVEWADSATGTDDDNVITASRSLVGRGGNDILDGTAQGGYYDAGPGDDVLETGGGRADVRCGPGADSVVGVNFETLVAPDCELVDDRGSSLGFARVPRQPVSFSPAAGTATFTVPCTSSDPRDKWCRASALIRGVARPARRVAWLRAGFGAQATLTVPLPLDIRSVLARGGVPTIYQLVEARTGPRRKERSLHAEFETGYRTPLAVRASD